MRLNHLLTATAAIALMAGAAAAQDSAAPAPAAPAPAAQAAAPGAKVVASGDIIQTAEASGQFTTFLKAAEATNLTGLLKTNKNLTVFAPTDAAFAALPAGELDKLMLPENKAQLQKLLVGHVVNAPVKSADFKGATRKAPTVAGTTVELSGGDELMVNDAHIVQADITASNGIIQVIDKVLITGAPAAATASAAGADASTVAPAQPGPTSAAPAQTPGKSASIDGVIQCQAAEGAPVAESPVPEAKDAAAAPAAADAASDTAAQEPAAPPAADAAPAAEAPAEPAAPAATPAAPAADPGAQAAPEAPAATPGADASATVAAPAATAPTTSMQPVADTPENRAKYKPISHAGKRSSAKGN